MIFDEKKFLKPDLQIINFTNEDIITSSSDGDVTDPIDDNQVA